MYIIYIIYIYLCSEIPVGLLVIKTAYEFGGFRVLGLLCWVFLAAFNRNKVFSAHEQQRSTHNTQARTHMTELTECLQCLDLPNLHPLSRGPV